MNAIETCSHILRAAGLGLLVDADGEPTAELFELDLATLTPYHRVVIRTARAIWEGRLPPSVATIVGLC